MTTNLYWAPSSKNRENSLPKELKIAISRKLWDTDGSCGNGIATVDTRDLLYIEALRDMGVDGAQELMELIGNLGSIELWHGD